MITFDRADLDFQLFDVCDVPALCVGPYADYDRAAIGDILDVAERMAREDFLPHAALSDANEPTFVDGRAVLIPEIGAALAVYREAGFFGSAFDHSLGGMQMPESVRSAISFLLSMANIGTSGYILLTTAAANLLAEFASPDQAETFLKPMVEGRYFGTMCLSEPQAGSSLSDITTMATRREDGTFSITGRKMWISGGDQDISENIIHLVLAKAPGAPAGVKGLSLFIVPKYLVGADGVLGPRNGVSLAGLNHKMGYRGTTNTALNFGEAEDCVGYLVGEEGRGLSYMFRMMNEARVAVGLGATALAAAGYQVSLAYARERLQGRPVGAKKPAAPPVPIIDHADVRRLLLAQKAAVEGSLALLLYTATLLDRLRLEPEPEDRERIESLLGLLTPIAKSWPSEFCLEANKHAIQVLGGAGYTRDYPVERLYRDNRLNPIHEGAHGIHGLDLLGRKLTEDDGVAFEHWSDAIAADIAEARTVPQLAEFADSLGRHIERMKEVTDRLLALMSEEPAAGLANATLYLDAMGHVTIGWMWLRQATTAHRLLDAGDSRKAHLEGKFWALRYFFLYVLPQAALAADLLGQADRTTLDIPASAF